MSFCVKVFCLYPNGKQETRRFRVAENESFIFLHQKIKSIFRLNNNRFSIKWIDEDEDEVDFTDDEELAEALRSMNKQRNPDILYLNVVAEDDSLPTICHDGIECDECCGPIRGFRYKCLQCDDYDLCMSCEARGNHKVHHMIRIPKKDPRANITFAELKRTVQYGPQPNSASKAKGKEPNAPPQGGANQEIPSNGRENFHRRCHRRHMNRGNFWNNISGADGGSHRWGNRHRGHFPFEAETLCSDATRVAEEARSLAMKHATDIMKGIWTGWVGDQNTEEQATNTPTAADAAVPRQEQGAEGITIDITVNKKDGVKHRCSVPEMPIDEVQPVTEMIEVIDLSKQDIPADLVQPMETNVSDNSENVSVFNGWNLIGDNMSMHSSEGSAIVVTSPVSPQLSSGVNTPVQQASGISTPVQQASGISTPVQQASGDATPTLLPEAVSLTPQTVIVEDKGDASNTRSVYPSVNAISSTDSPSSHLAQRIQWALDQMKLMGYTDEGGILTRLLLEKNGNINDTLDAIMAGKI